MTRAIRVFAWAQFNQTVKGSNTDMAGFAFPHKLLPVFDFLNHFLGQSISVALNLIANPRTIGVVPNSKPRPFHLKTKTFGLKH
jgi:hypothetical protein